MIYLIIGDNSYLARQHVIKLCKDFGGDCTRVDGEALNEEKLADLMMGGSLFSQKRVIVVSDLSSNTAVWDKLAEWSGRCSDDTLLIVLEVKPDRRTKTYKALSKTATVIVADRWTERDGRQAEEWLRGYVKQAGKSITPDQVSNMISRATVPTERSGKFAIDQMQLYTALQAMGSIPEITDEAIATVMPSTANENVFDLLSVAVNGDTVRAKRMLADFRANEDPYKLFALISAQWIQLVSLAVANQGQHDDINGLGIHPYVAQKLRALASRFSRQQLQSLTQLCANIDRDMKLSRLDPWDAVERFITGVVLELRP